MKLAKRLFATLLAVTMLLGVFSTIVFADVADEHDSEFEASYFPYNNGNGLWAGYQSDGDFSSFTGSNLASGDYGDYKPASSYNTFFATFRGGSYGEAGVLINGFIAIVADTSGGALSVSDVEGKVDFYVNADTTGNWNNWKKIGISSIDATTINGLGSFIFWWQRNPCTADHTARAVTAMSSR